MMSDGSAPATRAPTAQRSRGRRTRQVLSWAMGSVTALVLLLAVGVWWALGSDRSLAFALAQTARFLPAGQSLESRDVTGSLRAGGRIGWLRWQSESLDVQVRDARVGWELAPLLRRRVRLGEVHAAQVIIERRHSAERKPVEPLEQIVLPVQVELPFLIDELRWAGPPQLTATKVAGNYRYAHLHHQLEITGLEIADGHYEAQVKLQGPAPMAMDAWLTGRVRAVLPEGRSIDTLANASVKGTLAGAAARLAVVAQLKPVEQGAQSMMQAHAQVNIAPWLPQPVIDAEAKVQNVDLARLWSQAPGTLLSGEISAGPDVTAGRQGWQVTIDMRNGQPDAWDLAKLPIEQLEARASFDGSTWTLSKATVRVGGGYIEAEGSWSPAPAPWQAQASVREVRAGALHTRLAGGPVSGRIAAEQRDEALVFDVSLQAQGQGAADTFQALRLERALAQGQWQSGVLDLRSLRLEAQRASLEGRLQLRVDEQAGSGRLSLAAPGGTAQVDGRIAPTAGGGEVQARVTDAAALQRWIEGLPELDAAFAGVRAQGNARLVARWSGGWQAVQRRLQEASAPAPRGSTELTLQATLTSPKLQLHLPSATLAATALTFNGVHAELSGSLAQATLTLQGEASTGSRKIALDTRATGGLEHRNQWHAALASFRLQFQDGARSGPWILELGRTLTVQGRTVSGNNPRLEVDASAATATLKGPVPGTLQIDWQPLRLSHREIAGRRALHLQSKGRFQGLPMAWAKTLGESDLLVQVGFSENLIFEGEWNIDASDTMRARARLTRQSGDLHVQTGEDMLVTRITSHGTGTASERTMDIAGSGASTSAGVRRAELKLDIEGEVVRANLVWDSERAGAISAEASTRVQQRAGGWQWADDAPLAGRVAAHMPQLGVWSVLAPPGWRVAGTLEADATLSGHRAEPRWNGVLGADKLALRAPVEGLELRDGRLRVALAGNRVEITEFTLKGSTATQTRIPGRSGNLSTSVSEASRDGDALSARGELSWGATPAAGAGTGIRMAIQGQLRALRVLARSDRQLALSGDLHARLEGGQLAVRGKLQTDYAAIILPDATAPRLGSDVVVRSVAMDREAAELAQGQATATQRQRAKLRTTKQPDIAVSIDLGNDFAVSGHGLSTRLEGKLDIQGTALNAPPRIMGEVRSVSGRFRAYGQDLSIETGVARFNGPFDNPQLDVLAIRSNISQRAGIAINGTAQAPRLRLFSEPQVSDQEALSWLVLGRASGGISGESLLLQRATLALIGGLGRGGTGTGLASRLGLDEIGFGPGSGGESGDAQFTLGKRLARDFYVTYEHGLGGTLGTLFIFFDLTHRLTLRAQGGRQNGIDLIYTVRID